jgi:hypothetical protein
VGQLLVRAPSTVLQPLTAQPAMHPCSLLLRFASLLPGVAPVALSMVRRSRAPQMALLCSGGVPAAASRGRRTAAPHTDTQLWQVIVCA